MNSPTEEKRCQYVYPEGHEKAGERCRGMRGAAGYCAGHVNAFKAQKAKGMLETMPEGIAEETIPEALAGDAAASDLASADWAAELDALRRDPAAVKAFRQRWLKTIRSGSDDALDKLQKLMAAMQPPQQQTVDIPRTWALIEQLSDEQVQQAMRQLEAELGVDPSVDH